MSNLQSPRLSVQLSSPSDSGRRQGCANPGCSVSDPQHVCGRCMTAYYCSRECQQHHYADHKALCKQIASQFCSVKPPALIGYDAEDPADRTLVDRITIKSQKQPSRAPVLLPVFIEHRSHEGLIDETGQYAGVALSAVALETIIRKQKPQPGLLYALPTVAGVACCTLDCRDAQFLSAAAPKRVSLKAGKDKTLPMLLQWRMASVSKSKDAASKQLNQMDAANVAQELLCLVDKTVFPTLQLMRALQKRGALMVTVETDALAWSFVPLEELGQAGSDVLRNLSSYNIDQAVVTLTSGAGMPDDASGSASTVMLVNPLHVLQAFHKQQLDSKVMEAMGAMPLEIPCQLDIDGLLGCQSRKYKLGSTMADESEA